MGVLGIVYMMAEGRISDPGTCVVSGWMFDCFVWYLGGFVGVWLCRSRHIGPGYTHRSHTWIWKEEEGRVGILRILVCFPGVSG